MNFIPLFKNKDNYFYLYNDTLCSRSNRMFEFDLIDISEVELLYHYTNEHECYPVFYDHKDRFISIVDGDYDVLINIGLSKDYTYKNLKLLEDDTI